MAHNITLKPTIYKLLPLLVWLLLLLMPLVVSPPNMPEPFRFNFIKHAFILNSLLLIVFYAHTYVVYGLLQQKGWLIYLVALFVLLAVYWLAWYYLRGEMPKPKFYFPQDMQRRGIPPPAHFGPKGGGPGAFIPILSPFIALLFSFCYIVLLDNAKRQQLIKERETVHLRTELSLLRSQINPHFLFNILNNLTSLARKRSELMEPAIINLSQLMRYMLFESDDNKVVLSKEVEYLKSYIDLQMLRFGDEVSIITEFKDNYENYLIDPMLLISLVENAFKHGTGENEHASIYIKLNVDHNSGCLDFLVANSFIKSDTKYDGKGIGLKNLRRRLDLLYPQKHDLRTENNGMLFTAHLIINLS